MGFRAALAAILICAAAPALAADEDIAKFYGGLQMKMIIRSAPGGSYDTYGRLLARHIGRHLPGNPAVVSVNMPGASGIKAANYVAEIAPKDGSIITNVSLGFPMYQAMGQLKAVKTDMRDFNWLGTLNATNQVLALWHNAPVKSLDDAKRAEALVGAATPESTGAQLPRAYNILLGTKFKVVTGYGDIAAVRLAIERGEVAGLGSDGWSDLKTDFGEFVKNKQLNVILQVGLHKEHDLPDVPLLVDQAKTPEDRAVLEFITKSNASIGKPFATSPGVPPARVAALRRAFDETMKDPQLLAEADKMHIEIEPIDGVGIQKIVTDIVTTPKPVIERVKNALGITAESSIQ
ncbi:MAG: Bug family tripartite tricarboxylate transporter substrate binding protein [Gemmatimonas sp.]